MVPASNVIPSPNIDKSIFEIPFTAYFKAAADRLEDSYAREAVVFQLKVMKEQSSL